MQPIQYRPAGRSVKEIASSIEHAISTGQLSAGQLLPSVRSLAADLAVAPGTVAAAYRKLADRGLLESRGRAGTSVRRIPALISSRSVLDGAGLIDLASGQPDPHLLPDLAPTLARLAGGPAAAPHTGVLPALADLARARLVQEGVPAEQISVASGGLDAVRRMLDVHLHSGDMVALEDPGWPNARDLVASMGLRTLPLMIDEAGPTPESLQRVLDRGAAAVLITNRAQNPTGACLTAARAAELVPILQHHPEVLVMEDDHAGELASVPLATVAGSTRSWGLVRSVSKPYGPDLRVAVLAADDQTISRVDTRLRMSSGWVSTLLQAVVVGLWRDPAVGKTITDAGVEYDRRRTKLITCLAQRGVQSIGLTGINVWVPVLNETRVLSSLVQRGWTVAEGARFRHDSPLGVRITVSQLRTRSIDDFADQFAAAIQETGENGRYMS